MRDNHGAVVAFEHTLQIETISFCSTSVRIKLLPSGTVLAFLISSVEASCPIPAAAGFPSPPLERDEDEAEDGFGAILLVRIWPRIGVASVAEILVKLGWLFLTAASTCLSIASR